MKTNVTLRKSEYATFLNTVKKRIRSAQYEALKSVNKELIALYWDIGKLIAGKQKSKSWGKGIVETLAVDLQKEFPGTLGFSARNIWNMRNLYLAYVADEKLQPLVAEIGWTHNIIILDRCKEALEREFYIRMTRKMGWSKNVLVHQIDNQTYEKTLLNQTNFAKALPEKIRNQAKLAVKDEYTFEFLELADKHDERELEKAVLAGMDAFLREAGGAMSFMGSQYRLRLGDNDYFIDILLYHRDLRSLIAIELKAGKFIPEYVGKMEFYLSLLNDTVRLKHENPSIGIIVCKEKDRLVVEYALKQATKPVGVATYTITQTLPKELRRQLPGPEQIERLLKEL